ncbi:MAG: hypothetical protein MHPSP_004857, partial [Paramarteilia canceri]
ISLMCQFIENIVEKSPDYLSKILRWFERIKIVSDSNNYFSIVLSILKINSKTKSYTDQQIFNFISHIFQIPISLKAFETNIDHDTKSNPFTRFLENIYSIQVDYEDLKLVSMNILTAFE